MKAINQSDLKTDALQPSAEKYSSFPLKPISLRGVGSVFLISAAGASLVALLTLQNLTEPGLAKLKQETLFSVKGFVARPLFWVMEEIIFRGFLLQILRRKFSLSFALFVSGLLFALEHFGKGLPVMALAFGSSYYFAWLMIRTDSLYAPIVAHCSFDAVALYVICPVAFAYGHPVDGRYSFSLWWYSLALLALVFGVSILHQVFKTAPKAILVATA